MVRAVFQPTDALDGIFAVVVDGEKERRALLAGILRYCGALVAPVEAPDDALTIMRLLRPDVIVVDVPGADDRGFAFMRNVRGLAADAGSAVKAIAVGENEDAESRAREEGFDSYLVRPLEPWEICRVVAELLDA